MSFIISLLKSSSVNFSKALFLISAAIIAWFYVDCPNGLAPQAFHLLIIFVATMIGIMLEICHGCVLLFISLLISSLTGVIEVKKGFSGFTNTVPWLLFFILSLSQTIKKTSLGMRIAYLFIKLFGKGILGLSYSISLTEVIMAAILPSNTARCASIGYPLVGSLSKYISQHIKGISEKSIGAYLTLLYCHSNAICSGLFLTALISNAIIIDVLNQQGVNITWLSWAKFMAIPCFSILMLLPIILRLVCNPKVKDLSNIQAITKKNYENLGPISNNEKLIISVFLIMLIMWIISDLISISIIETTLIGLGIFLILGIIDIKEILSSSSTFNSVFILGFLISLVNNMQALGVMEWINTIVSGSLSGFSPHLAFFFLTVIYFFTHYFFSGEGARIIALYAPFLITGIAIGVDQNIVAMTLAFFSSASDILAHYTCPVSIMMFNLEYVAAKKWMALGPIFAVLIIIIWHIYINVTFNF
jgi:DASS family divalent anion:Na+ symporter